jgi:signal transduction histidine kinase
LAGIISLADALVRKEDIGFSGNYCFSFSPEEIAQSLGLDATKLPPIDEDELLAQNEPLTHSSQTQALSKAVQQLGQLNEELLERQTRMSQRTQNLQAIQQFVSEISDTSTLSDLVLGIARAAVQLFPHDEKHPLAAYSISQQAPEILAAFYGSSSPTTCITLPAEPRRRSARLDGLGNSAQGDMQELLDDLDELWPRLDLTLARHEPLLCRGEWIGGILYVPTEGASLPSSQEALIDVMSMALSVVQSRCDAVALSEQLAGASQILSETQEALAEAKTLSAVGEMAAGAAHEMNNPLAVISGRAQLMRERAENEKDRKIWNTIAEQTQRVSDIISDLMEFAAPTQPNPSAVNIAELFTAARNLFYQSDTAQVSSSQVDISIGNPLPKAWVDRGQIESALTELITNAATAARERSKISLAAEYDELTAMVRLTVIDEGPGMDASTLSQAFTPFFSLQKAGRRRGLGLPRVKRQVEINGGQIRIDSQPGRGTRVQMYLPSVK